MEEHVIDMNEKKAIVLGGTATFFPGDSLR